MIVLILLGPPLLLGLVLEYILCRFPKSRLWRYLPPAVAAVITWAGALHRYHGWSTIGEKAPVETLLLVPGVSAAGAFLGFFLGWKLWKWIWGPKVVKDRKREG